MITTVTTTTTTMQNFGVALGIMLTLALIGLLVAKDLMSSGEADRSTRRKRILNIGIAPLMFCFAVLVLAQIVAAL